MSTFFANCKRVFKFSGTKTRLSVFSARNLCNSIGDRFKGTYFFLIAHLTRLKRFAASLVHVHVLPFTTVKHLLPLLSVF